MMYKGKAYQRRKRWYATKAMTVLAAIVYYGLIYHPCVKHIAIMITENRTPILNFIK